MYASKQLYLLPLQLLPFPDELQQQSCSLQVVAEAVPLLQLLLQRLVRLHAILQKSHETQISTEDNTG